VKESESRRDGEDVAARRIMGGRGEEVVVWVGGMNAEGGCGQEEDETRGGARCEAERWRGVR
jgi:hypothetical protein